MRFSGILGIGLSLIGAVALNGGAWADGPAGGDNPAFKDNSSNGIVSRLFPDDNMGPPWRMKAKRQKDRMENPTGKKPTQTKIDSKKAEVKKPVESAPKEPSAREKELAEVKREQADYLRRLAVCDQLRDIALKNSDESLNRQADELQAQAWSIYTKHVAAHSVEAASGSKDLNETGSKEEKP
jgi:hypothetical protein